MRRRWGLRGAMTATYVAVTAGAVLLTELVIFAAAALSPPVSLTPKQVQGLVAATAAELAAKTGNLAGKTGTFSGADLSTGGTRITPGRAQPDGAGAVSIPPAGAAGCDPAPASFGVIVSRTGTVVATSYPGCFPVGSRGSDAQRGTPRKVLTLVRWQVADGGLASLPGGTVAWATAPVRVTPPAEGKPPAGAGQVGGMLYVEVPAAASAPGGVTVSPELVKAGLAVLGAAVPVGLAFGMLSTRRLIRRLRRLAGLTLEVADGGFDRRVPVSGRDEVSQLEENFNRMAGQLQASLDARRELAEENARHQERGRIARELHDSISQELFSLSVIAGGLRRALPAGSVLLPQVATMERTAGDTMREMRALLLALRPVTLDEAGLAGAIEGLCQAYGQRLGVRVRAELDPVTPPPAVEHAILRVAQEALGNAVRHAGADHITVRLRVAPGGPPASRPAGDGDDGADVGEAGQEPHGTGQGTAAVLLEVADDGRGFDLAARLASPDGLGLRTMRDRVAEHDGRLAIDTAPGSGTRLRAVFPLPAGGGEQAPRPAAAASTATPAEG